MLRKFVLCLVCMCTFVSISIVSAASTPVCSDASQPPLALETVFSHSTCSLLHCNALAAGSMLKPLTNISEEKTPFLYKLCQFSKSLTADGKAPVAISDFLEQTRDVSHDDFAAECRIANGNVSVDFEKILDALRADLSKLNELLVCPSPAATDAKLHDGGGG